MRLEARTDGVYYVAIPSGKNELPFKLTSVEDDKGDRVFSFTGPSEGFPQRIVYRRTAAGMLFAEVDGKVDGKDKQVIYPMHHVDCVSGGGPRGVTTDPQPVAAADQALHNLERLLASGKDGALLRFGLGNEYLKRGDAAAAVTHLRRAVAIDPGLFRGVEAARQGARPLRNAMRPRWRPGAKASRPPSATATSRR